MTAGPYWLEPAENLDPAAMTVLRRIYEEGFPPHLRADFARRDRPARPKASWRWRWSSAGSHAGSPCSARSAAPAGSSCAISWWISGQRGQGLGGLLWEQLTARLREAGYTLLVFDVEDPDEPGCGRARPGPVPADRASTSGTARACCR